MSGRSVTYVGRFTWRLCYKTPHVRFRKMINCGYFWLCFLRNSFVIVKSNEHLMYFHKKFKELLKNIGFIDLSLKVGRVV